MSTITQTQLDHLLTLVRQVYPDWQNFNHPAFVQDEIDYKQTAANLMRTHLGRAEFERLLRLQLYDELINRLEKVAHATNLLYLSTPQTGDLRLLYAATLDRGELCRQLFALLYGNAAIEVRFQHYLDFVGPDSNLNYWTFPTYFLFLAHPDREMFVKPSIVPRYLPWFGLTDLWRAKPNVDTYVKLVTLAQQLQRALTAYGPHDLIDIQGLLWVAARQQEKHDFTPVQYWKISPGENGWQWADCLAGNFIAIGWDELGDLTGVSRTDFDQRRDTLLAQHSDWSKVAVNQVWSFAKQIKEGDRIVANRGTSELLGIGTVTGPYYFVPAVRHGHRLPVEWDETTPRPIAQGGWRKTLIQLDRTTFDAVSAGAPLPTVAPALAAPFSVIFTTKADALWAFTLIADTLTAVGITDPADERFALTTPLREQHCLHLNIGDWLVLGFQDDQLRITFIDDVAIDPTYHWFDFSQGPTETPIRGYRIPYHLVQPMPPVWQQAYHTTLQHIADRFRTWSRSRYRRYHVPAIAAAVFDSSLREQLLTTGIADLPEVPPDDQDTQELTEQHAALSLPDPVPGCPFSRTTFDLLAQLHATPTTAFYLAHKEGFTRHVEEPFKQLLLEVGRQLPAPIRTVMETERRLFARFPKNDWGQGGAWDFYWGAFYPKGSKRAQDAQLSMWMNYRFLEFGFYIGNYASEQRLRFQHNCERHVGPLSDIMRKQFQPGEIILGSRDDFTVTAAGTVIDNTRHTWDGFIRNPAAANCDASLVIPAATLLTLTFEELVRRILHGHQRLFPLVLTAIEDDPMPAIAAYLEAPQPDADDEEDPITPTPASDPPPRAYTRADFLREAHLLPDALDDLLELLADKRQLILQGPPGTGKTYVAQRLAKLLTGLDQPGACLTTVQFHPAYSYEDFMEGIRPDSRTTITGQAIIEYPVRPGHFLSFCAHAARDTNRPYVFIIDEINRGNIARIFGELMYLLEYRNESVALPYSGNAFSIPSNVYLIGTMNTADRSIALVDFALRRRFHFMTMAADPDLFDRWLATQEVALPYLSTLYRRLCHEAIDDPAYRIGPSYFMQPGLTAAKLARIWRYSIEPLLNEYYAENLKLSAAWHWESSLVQTIRNGGSIS